MQSMQRCPNSCVAFAPTASLWPMTVLSFYSSASNMCWRHYVLKASVWLYVITYFAWCSISVHSGGIAVKYVTNIQHASAIAENVFPVSSHRSRSSLDQLVYNGCGIKAHSFSKIFRCDSLVSTFSILALAVSICRICCTNHLIAACSLDCLVMPVFWLFVIFCATYFV